MIDWIKSDYCSECDGEGFVRMKTFDTGEYAEFENFQCEECERLHQLELRADRLHDEAKGN